MVDADWITKGATLLSADWKAFDGEIVGLVLVVGAVLAPVYLILQAWFGYAWTGRWRIVALVPLAGLVVFTFFNLRAPVNITDPLAALMLFAPLGPSTSRLRASHAPFFMPMALGRGQELRWPDSGEPVAYGDTVRAKVSLRSSSRLIRAYKRVRTIRSKMQYGSRRHFDGMDVLAIQIKIIEGRQSDQRYRHFAEHGPQCGRRPLEILSPTTGRN